MGLLPISGVRESATSHVRERRAKMGLALPVPAPSTSNDVMSSIGEDGVRRNNDGVAVTKCRIQWTCALDADLARCSESITLRRGEGRQNELAQLWCELHPELQQR